MRVKESKTDNKYSAFADMKTVQQGFLLSVMGTKIKKKAKETCSGLKAHELMFAIAYLRPVILSHITFGVPSVGHCDTLQRRKVHTHIKKKWFCFVLTWGRVCSWNPDSGSPKS